jgi:hypothetical protein
MLSKRRCLSGARLADLYEVHNRRPIRLWGRISGQSFEDGTGSHRVGHSLERLKQRPGATRIDPVDANALSFRVAPLGGKAPDIRQQRIGGAQIFDFQAEMAETRFELIRDRFACVAGVTALRGKENRNTPRPMTPRVSGRYWMVRALQ